MEVDETYIGGEEAGLAGGRAKGKKALVAVAVELRDPKGFGRCRMRIIPNPLLPCTGLSLSPSPRDPP
nr:hypothetical protein [Leekyejoonella antrihumi]